METIFDPRKVSNYKDDYPELSRISEFRDLSDKELEFAWYMGNTTSPFYNIDNDKRLKESVKVVFGIGETADKYLKKDYHQKISNAITKMGTFIPTLRSEAYNSVSNIFNRLIEISNLKPSDFKDKEGIVDYKKQLDIYAEALEQLPKALKIAEEGFGIKEDTSKKLNPTELIKTHIQNTREK